MYITTAFQKIKSARRGIIKSPDVMLQTISSALSIASQSPPVTGFSDPLTRSSGQRGQGKRKIPKYIYRAVQWGKLPPDPFGGVLRCETWLPSLFCAGMEQQRGHQCAAQRPDGNSRAEQKSAKKSPTIFSLNTPATCTYSRWHSCP